MGVPRREIYRFTTSCIGLMADQTSIENSVCLCSSCHTKVHEGGYRIQKVDNNEQRLTTQFEQQQQADDNNLFDFEKALRDDRESFDTIRALSPTRYRFRIVDANGRDIRYVYDATNISATTNTLIPQGPQQATRVACAESPPSTYGFTKTRSSLRRTRWGTTEQSAVYHVNSAANLH